METSGHTPESISILVFEQPDDRRLVLHCAGGSRSSIAAGLLRREGREDVYDLIGGYTARAAAPTE
ncbi:rhodanese-like domain-containing protein [Kitasatospora sp. NPDC058190]|uniref:rhodanese-like domain-containing protein n=1 Tax=Kitasatospora sp. NPDC058190 TaxID=3346371 RepID=UPI0036D80BB0